MAFRIRSVVLLAVAILALPAIAADAVPDERRREMTTFQLVLISDNPEFEEDESVGDAMAAHRVDRMKTASDLYLRNLVKGKLAVIAGPLIGHERIRFVAILRTPSVADAERAFQASPGIQAGRQQIEVYPWTAPKNIFRRPKDLHDTRFRVLGLLKRPANLPELTTERLEEIQQGHLEHNEAMIALGALVITGPVDNGGDLRGIMIFRTHNPDKTRKLVADDPAIEADRLELDLYRWRIPKHNWIRRDYQTGASKWP